MLTDDDKIFKVGYYELDNPHKNFWVLDGDKILTTKIYITKRTSDILYFKLIWYSVGMAFDVYNDLHFFNNWNIQMNIYKDDDGVEYIKDIFNKEDKTIKYNRVAYFEREKHLSYEGYLNLTLQFNSVDLNKYTKLSNIRKLKYGFNFSNDDITFKIGYYEIRLANNNMAIIRIEKVTEKSIIFTYETEGLNSNIKKKKFKFKNDNGEEYIKDFQNQKGFEAVVLNHYMKNQIRKRVFSMNCGKIIIDGKQIPEDIEKLICDFI